ncbi:MAG: PKD domain-containing protein [Acidobacteria bacterium]|nr:PKD domain-containing protein [Acidobacteriota bacterium]
MGHSFKIAMAAALLAGTAACTVHQADSGPEPFGPSDFGLSLDLTITPDSLNQDGASQASVVVVAHDQTGAPKANVVVRLVTSLDGTIREYGTLSARSVVTGSDGRASAIYTAPATSLLAPGEGIVVTIVATPSGSDAQAANSRTAQLRLVPPGVILPPAQTPTAQFTYSPAPVNFNIASQFDASTSCGGSLSGGACPVDASAIASYAWTFGDGTSAAGKVVSHTYVASTQATTSFNVTLTVTNDRGLSASTTQAISVSASPAPSGDWVFSPTAPNVNETIYFNGDGVRAAAGHSIVQWSWNFGDGTTASGFQATHSYTAARTYTVVLSVLDDAGAKTVLPKTVTVGTGNPNAVLTVTKTGGNDIRADGGSSSAAGGSTISTYTFDFGSCSATGQSGSQSFGTRTCAAGTHTIRLTVTDSLGRSSSTTQSVTVP